ncbi:hypothetical protein [Aquimarina sp. 2201CG5-10]|uniref:hypothetical protein n=1 Tax=Aquimarina callyspongiae TaxID=3098150 RepID=UPI002AB3DDF4|nr:hypothetical protein [Aquimarina sp. 2201CG5-10]MDY8137991.1 hypothetical protein [Aquimarina sp. 2201CG5-10]
MNILKSIFTIIVLSISLSSCGQEDKIVGVWDVKTEYYQATYEIVSQDDTFFGKVHYYNDGSTEYKGKNKKEDYFLTDVELKDGKYVNGKMYTPDGSYYEVIFTLKNNDTLETIMTVENKPYKEIWTRNTTY